MLKINKLQLVSFGIVAIGWLVSRMETKKDIEEAVEEYMAKERQGKSNSKAK